MRGFRARVHGETGPQKIVVQPETAGGVGANQPVGSDAKQAFIKRIARPPWGQPGICNETRAPVAIEICSAPPIAPPGSHQGGFGQSGRHQKGKKGLIGQPVTSGLRRSPARQGDGRSRQPLAASCCIRLIIITLFPTFVYPRTLESRPFNWAASLEPTFLSPRTLESRLLTGEPFVASQAVQLALSCLPGASRPVQLVLSCLPGASLVPRRLSHWSFPASLVPPGLSN